ncbi:hypothetical protein DHW03_15225 [Pedobacter yonginense]|uniref:DUF6597 domain-containing protein n=1 Tax=Pedobacter yonginense TaxID=651869 RepID=A0A317EIH2_9SPHI|nr:hypothetical protein DHW03_15225 [Pedobacter yonginense]
MVKTGSDPNEVKKILPDGCIDIILNLGSDLIAENGIYKIRTDSATLFGTMTIYKDIIMNSNTYLLGFRFKPLGFFAFYRYDSLDLIANKSVEF